MIWTLSDSFSAMIFWISSGFSFSAIAFQMHVCRRRLWRATECGRDRASFISLRRSKLGLAVDHLGFGLRFGVLHGGFLASGRLRERVCSICFCLSGKRVLHGVGLRFGLQHRRSALGFGCFDRRAPSVLRPRAPLPDFFLFHFEFDAMRSFSCSLISTPSSPLAYSVGSWMSRSTTSLTMTASAPRRGDGAAAVWRISSRLRQTARGPGRAGRDRGNALATTGGTNSFSSGCGRFA